MSCAQLNSLEEEINFFFKSLESSQNQSWVQNVVNYDGLVTYLFHLTGWSGYIGSVLL